MEKEVLLTKEGLKKLEDELNELKTTKRREVAEKIKIARGFGDLSENAEYDEAKLEQAQNEDRVLKIEEMLRNATVIEEDDAKGDIVKIGSKVRLLTKSLMKKFPIQLLDQLKQIQWRDLYQMFHQ